MRTIKAVHQAEYSIMGGLVTWSPLPGPSLEQIDPFLLLNHHGPQTYEPRNQGLPFGPHPHRGMETVTFIFDGDLTHKDSTGHESVIGAGGVQWMTAGRGLIHAETSSAEFKRTGGGLDLIQLWLNLPARLKMTAPFYKGLQREAIPHLSLQEGKVLVDVVSGNWEGQNGAFESLTDVHLSTITLGNGADLALRVPPEYNILFYIMKGGLTVNGREVLEHHLVEFENDAEEIALHADNTAHILFGHAMPFNEPLVAQGPFVMNTEEEIRQAYEDYRRGKFGTWK
jgi:redox-sensitive bicupin YhaK (pirin superfamily)